MNLNPYLTPYTKINSKWMRPKLKGQNYKILRRKHRNRSSLTYIWQWFLRYNIKNTSKKGKKINWTSAKLKTFVHKGHYQYSEKNN